MGNSEQLAKEFLQKKVKVISDFEKLDLVGNAPTSHATPDTVWYVTSVFYNIVTMSYDLNLMITINDGIMNWDRHLFTSVPHKDVKVVM